MLDKADITKYAKPVSGITFLFVVLWGLWSLFGGIWNWLESEQNVPLNSILISGDRTFIQDDEVEQLIRRSQKGSFIELQVDDVHDKLLNMPWVYRASVRKEWPDTLRIYLVEQVAVAQWNDDMMLNQYGQSFQARVPKELAHLPVLFGPGGSEKTALEGYRAMQGLLNAANLDIVEMFLSERYAWHLTLGNKIDLNLGRTEFIDRLQRFIDIYPLLLRNEKTVKYVDLRYDTGLAVGWNESTGTDVQRQLNG